MAVGGIDRRTSGIPEADRVDVEEPGVPAASSGGGKENVPGIQIGMTKAVALELFAEPADSGKDPGALPGEGSGGKNVIQVAPPLDERSGDLHPEKRSGRVEKSRLDARGGYAHLDETF